MSQNKNLTLLIVGGAVVTLALTAVTHFSHPKDADPPQQRTVRVLRQKNLRGFKPSRIEIEDSLKGGDRRSLQDDIPKHIPIKVRIKTDKEPAFADLTNEHWLRAFELEVKNTGTKPIYFIELVLDFPETRGPDGSQIAYSLMYGRGELISIMEPLKATDIPLNAGETHVFKLAERYLKGWDNLVQQDHIPQPKKVSVVFQFINFGDGSGFRGSTGQPVTKIQTSSRLAKATGVVTKSIVGTLSVCET